MRMVLTLDSLEESRALSLLCRLCALLRESPHAQQMLRQSYRKSSPPAPSLHLCRQDRACPRHV